MRQTKKILFLINLFLIGSLSLSAHPFYVSIFQIDFNRETNAVEISVRINADDLLFALGKRGETDIYLGEDKERPDTDKLIFNYIKDKLKLTINGKKTEFRFIGKEMDTNILWSYLEIENITDLQKIEVNCDLLTEVFPTQSNIIQVNNGVEIKNLLLNKMKTQDSLTF